MSVATELQEQFKKVKEPGSYPTCPIWPSLWVVALAKFFSNRSSVRQSSERDGFLKQCLLITYTRPRFRTRAKVSEA
jgi:hypothetical protein